MDHPLDDCRLKTQRAREQFEDLQREIQEFFHKHPCEIACRSETATGRQTVKVPEPPELPRRWGLLLGEACHNARSALDHMVYALAGSTTETSRTSFPIFENCDDYWKTSRRGRRATTARDRYLAGVDENSKKNRRSPAVSSAKECVSGSPRSARRHHKSRQASSAPSWPLGRRNACMQRVRLRLSPIRRYRDLLQSHIPRSARHLRTCSAGERTQDCRVRRRHLP